MEKGRQYNVIKIGTTVCRFVLALVFIFSGFVKAIDPLGTLYKIQDYVNALRWMDFVPDFLLNVTSFGIGILEFCLGIYLFFGIRRIIAPYIVFFVMLLMTPLTFWIALYNPVSDLENGDELYHGTLSNDINVFLNRILKHDLSRADLGLYIDRIEDLSIEKQKHLKLNINRGTIITAVKNNASLSGIGTDYVITKINGKRVETLSELVSEMYKYNERTIIKVTARKTNGSTETYYIKG